VARAARADLAWTVGLGLLAGIVLVGQAHVLSRVIGQAFLGGRSLPDLAPLVAILVGLAVVRAALAWGGEVAAQRAAGRVKRRAAGQAVGPPGGPGTDLRPRRAYR